MPTRNHASSPTTAPDQLPESPTPESPNRDPLAELLRPPGGTLREAAATLERILSDPSDENEDEEDEGWNCAHCDEHQEDSADHYYIQGSDGEEVWCCDCYENDTFRCDFCDQDFDSCEFSYSLTANDDRACLGCYEEETESCARCGNRYSNHRLSRVVTDHETFCVALRRHDDIPDSCFRNWCEDCRDEETLFSAYSGYDFSLLSPSDSVAISNIPNAVVHRVEIAANPSAFAPDLSGNNSTIMRASLAAEWSARQNRERGFQPSRHRSRESILNNLRNKALNDLQTRPASYAPPVHDRIYIGIELEAQAGQLVIDQPLRVLNQELGCPYPTCPEKKIGRQCTHGVRIVRDGSIRGEGWEFLPPIVKHKKGWEQVEKLVKSLKDFGWSADSSCGIHFHLSHGMLNPDHPEIIRNVFRMFFWMEPIIFACLPLERRNNKYCYPISKYFTEEDIKKELKLDFWYYGNFWKKQIQRSDGNRREQHYRFNEHGEALEAISFGQGPYKKENLQQDKREHYYVGRYIGCNLHPLFSKGTIEFRYFPAYLDYSYIKNWAEIISRMVKCAIDGIDMNAIEQLSKNRGSLDGAIKEMVKLFKFPSSLGTFLKMESRKYRKQPEFVPTPVTHPIALRDIRTNIRGLEDIARIGMRLRWSNVSLYRARALVSPNGIQLQVNDSLYELSLKQWYIVKHLTNRITSNTPEILQSLYLPNQELLTSHGISSEDLEVYLLVKCQGNLPTLGSSTEAQILVVHPDLRNLNFTRTETPVNTFSQYYEASLGSMSYE